MIAAYDRLYRAGWAHSIEIWQEDALIGGLYGIIIGRVLFGESMFSDVQMRPKSRCCCSTACCKLKRWGSSTARCSPAICSHWAPPSFPERNFPTASMSCANRQSAFDNWPDAPIRCVAVVAGLIRFGIAHCNTGAVSAQFASLTALERLKDPWRKKKPFRWKAS